MRKAAMLLGLALGCGGGGGDTMMMGEPFMGRDIDWNSYYVYFPTDAAAIIVRDTLPRSKACELLVKHKRIPLPGAPDHYSLIIGVEEISGGNDITIDLDEPPAPGKMRYIGIGHYPQNAVTVPQGDLGVSAGGLIRVSELVQYQRIKGSYDIKFRTGETMKDSFDIEACP